MLITTTDATGVLVRAKWLHPGLHITARCEVRVAMNIAPPKGGLTFSEFLVPGCKANLRTKGRHNGKKARGAPKSRGARKR